MARKTKKSKILQQLERLAKENNLNDDSATYPQTVEHLNALKATYNHLIQGGTYTTAYNNLRSDGFKIGKEYCSGSCDEIIAEAKELIKADFKADREIAREKLFMYLQDIYTECRENGDRFVAVKAVAEMNKLLGLTETKNPSIKVQTKEGVTIKFGFGNDDEQEDNTEIQEAEIINE